MGVIRQGRPRALGTDRIFLTAKLVEGSVNLGEAREGGQSEDAALQNLKVTESQLATRSDKIGSVWSTRRLVWVRAVKSVDFPRLRGWPTQRGLETGHNEDVDVRRRRRGCASTTKRRRIGRVASLEGEGDRLDGCLNRNSRESARMVTRKVEREDSG